MHSICLCNDRASQHTRAKHSQLVLGWTLMATHSSGEGCWIQHLRECVFEGALHLLLWLVQLLCNLQLPWSRHALQLKRSFAASPAWRPQGTSSRKQYSRKDLMT